MKNKKYRFGLSILAGGLSFVGAANATDIVIDGSFETSTNNLSGVIGHAGNDAAGIDGGWTSFSTYTYSANYTLPGPAGCGQVYLRPYTDTGGTQIPTQVNSLTRAITASQIDAGNGVYVLSAWFSTYKTQNDYSDLTLQFLDASQSPIGSPVSIGGAAFVAALPNGAQQLRDWGNDSRTNVVPSGARYASISIVSTALSGYADGYVDLVSLNVSAGSVPVQLTGADPVNNATGVSPAPALSVTLEDGTAVLNTNSILFRYDGSPVSPVIQKSGTITTVRYTPPLLLAPLSTHTYQVAFNNAGGGTANTTNQYTFTVAPYMNVNLGPPIYLETFDGVAEGALPAGWSVQNHTDLGSVPGYDLNDFRSDAFLDWTVISRSTLSNWWGVTDGEWYWGVTNVAPNQCINGTLLNDLVSTNFIIAVSARDANTKQIDYLYTGDYNLSGRYNVYLSFHEMYVQYANNIASVEYSIDGGATWLPALYMLEPFRIFRNDAGNIDAFTTFDWRYWWDVPNVDTGSTTYGYFGQYIGVDSTRWSTLAPFISPRVQNDQYGSKRVEVIRLTEADNQPAVRFRMAFAGVYDWYFAIDDFGLYSVSNVSPPLVTSGPTPTPQTLTAGNTAYLTLAEPVSVFPFTYQWQHNGTDMPGKTGQALRVPTTGASEAGSYDVVVTNPGGSVTSSVAVLTVLDQRPIKVTGQWDFLLGNLTASYGTDMQYFDSTVQGDTTFGTTTSFGLPDIGGTPTTVMHFTPSTGIGPWGGYKMYHGAAPNGGGAYVNQYTLIYDIYYPSASDGKWRSMWQTATANGNDGDLYVGNWNGLGISSVYDGWVSPAAWHRIAFAIDLSGPGEAPVLTKFLDGVKQPHNVDGTTLVNQVLGEGTDGRWSLDPYALVFADENGDVAEAYVSSIQFSDGRRPDAYIQALGGPNALKIPGVLRADWVGGQVVIRWSGGVPLQSADSITGTWTTVPGTAGQYTYTPSPLEQQKFYRPQIP